MGTDHMTSSFGKDLGLSGDLTHKIRESAFAKKSHLGDRETPEETAERQAEAIQQKELVKAKAAAKKKAQKPFNFKDKDDYFNAEVQDMAKKLVARCQEVLVTSKEVLEKFRGMQG